MTHNKTNSPDLPAGAVLLSVLLVYDGTLDLVGGVCTGQHTGQRQRKGDGCPQCLSGDNISVNRDRQTCVAGPGGGQVGVHAGVDRCLFAVQHAEGASAVALHR